MAPPRSSKSAVQSKKARSTGKSKLSILSLDSIPSGSKKAIPTSAPSSSSSSKTRANVSKPMTSFAVHPAFLLSEKGKEKESYLSSPERNVVVEDQLWVDKYIPQIQEELAVHKKKVEDVRRWLEEAFDGGPTGVMKKYRRVLALTGPAGTGKTATLRVLSREMDFGILEWRNSLDDNFSGDSDDYDRESLMMKFQTFLTRASSCRALPLSSGMASSSSTVTPSRQIILLEDLPNVLHPGTAEIFHAALQDYITSPPGVPLVFIVSDTGTRGEDPESDLVGGRAWGRWGKQAVDVRSVVPSPVFNSPYFTEIQFNPIAPTLLVKALTSLLTQHFSFVSTTKSKAFAIQPTKDVVQMIVDSAHGDIRSAVMALQFACVVHLPKGKKKGGARSVLEAVTRREQSLALFHMLGKVLYNKRKGDPPNSSATAKDREREQELDAKIADPPSLPPHLEDHARRGSRVDINMLYSDSPIDTSLFALYLHQNYTQFCNEVDECEGVCEWLSWIDASGGELWQAQQNPHQFHLLTLGALHSLPSPVSRRAQKMFKPEFFDTLKKRREAEEAIANTEGWMNRAVENETEGGRRWARDEVVLELGGVLRALDACGIDSPQTHRAFTTLSFVHPTRMLSNSQEMLRLGEEEVPSQDGYSFGEGQAMTQAWRGVPQATEDNQGGCLVDDDIQEF